MGEVKRYVFTPKGLMPAPPSSLYGWVSSADYDTLRAEVERLREIERAAKAMIDAGLADIDDAERAYTALAEACGRKG